MQTTDNASRVNKKFGRQYNRSIYTYSVHACVCPGVVLKQHTYVTCITH